MRVLRVFDEYLEELDNYNAHKGIVSKLIQKNQLTQGKKLWKRILIYDIEVCFDMDFQNKVSQCRIQDYYAFPENSRTGFDRKVNAMFSLINANGTRWTFKIPLQYLLKGWGDANDGYQCYTHCIKLSKINDMFDGAATSDSSLIEKCYSGITKRNWLKRLEEHLREVRQGDNKLFHRAWREATDGKDVIYHSYLQWVNLSYEESMEWEERYVYIYTLFPKGLNMIPGGFEGNRHLYKHRITDRVDIDLDERERAIAEYVRQHPRKGIPNPFMSDWWKDYEHYVKAIGSRVGVLTFDQVRRIRELNKSGYSVAEITKIVGARNENQVKNVLANRTFKRVT
ncbi:MAG: hypothetical protein GTO02_14420 [Candidatus Dadabacteria bacterium]|nr:hypothetical protein [Candidatus Dadabacteria bacterium]